MTQPIVVGFEGSEHGKDALKLGRFLASAFDAPLVVAGVEDLQPATVALSPKLNERRRQLLAAFEETAAAHGGDPVIVVSTSAARGLHDLADEREARLIVVGSSHRGPVGRVLAGSVGRALLHGSPCAVAVAPAGFRDADDGMREIGVGVDGGEEAKAALREAVRLASATNAGIVLLGAADPPAAGYGGFGYGYGYDEIGEAIRRDFEGYLAEAAELVPGGIPVSQRLLSGGPASALAAEAKSLDLLVVGSRGYGPMKRVLLGSVASQLATSAPCPVIVVPRGASRTGAGTVAAGGAGLGSDSRRSALSDVR